MSDTITLTFTGDIGFDKYMEGRWEDDDLLSAETAAFLKDTDSLIVNVEGPLYKKIYDVNKPSDNLYHSMDPGVATFLKKIGADIWNICNNHIMDAGPEGIKSTLDIAASSGAKTLGAGMDLEAASAPLFIDAAGGIGMIGVGYQRACRKAGDTTPGCFSWSDLDLIRKRIEQIKSTCRWAIVVAHAGEEFTALPSPYTRDRYLAYLDMGADIVIAHHPHVVNNYELFGSKAIFYSLGNFIFDTDYQRSQMYTEYGMLLKLRLDRETFSFEPMGIKVDRTCERIVSCDAPPVFCDVQKDDYDLLEALAAKVLIENTKRQLRYMRPKDFENATEEDFVRNFYEPMRSGRVPKETLDMQIIYPLSQTFDLSKARSCSLTGLVDYMLSQI